MNENFEPERVDGSATQDVDPVDITANIVSAYLSNNHVQVAELPRLIADVHAALTGLITDEPAAAVEKPAERLPAAQIRKSIKPDALISFIDGKPYKTLKRHLTKHGLTVEGYRTRYGLPADYPITAASYSAKRSELAHARGLGRRSGSPRVEAVE